VYWLKRLTGVIRYISYSVCTEESTNGPKSLDNGGALVQKVNGKFVQFGILAFGFDSQGPSVYTDVSVFLTWINENKSKDF